MKHFGIVEWVEFARGAASAEKPMQAHLESGCPDCGQMAAFCRKLSSVCNGTGLRPVPDAVVRQALALFPAARPTVAKRRCRIPCELIYDSLLVPAPAGLRSSWQVGWQALFRAGDCSLDVRVEPELHSTRAALIGQVSSHAAPETEMVDLPVCLKAGKLVVARTRSNRFGEFQMEYEQQKRLQLCISLEGNRTLEVPVKRLSTDTAVGERLNRGTRSGRKQRKGDKG